MKKLLIGFYLILVTSIYAQNTISIPNFSGNAKSEVEIEIQINNADTFVAFQLDIFLPGQVKYKTDSAVLTNRKDDHSISATIINTNTLRVIAYSLSQKLFLGNSGTVAKFTLTLGSIPGIYPLQISNAIISSSTSSNILTNSVVGNLTILAPEVNSSTTTLDFGRVPLLNDPALTVTVSNDGNATLSVSSAYTDNRFFEIIGDTVFNVAANSSKQITVKFKSWTKGIYNNKLVFLSNDPDEPKYEINLKAVAFAVNELRQKSSSGRSGYPVRINYSINNMEPFYGVQFDLVLPPVLSLLSDSLKLTSRSKDHKINAAQISSNKIRVVIYSPTNKPFSGNDGDLLSLGFLLVGIGGNYNTTLENVIISDSTATNVVSDFYNSYVNIVSPNIITVSQLNFGESPINNFIQKDFSIENNGNDTLIINSLSLTNTVFKNLSTFPQRIPPSQNKSFVMEFRSAAKGSFTDRAMVRSNDPDQDPFYINLQASSYNPNYIIAADTTANVNDTCTVSIKVDNVEQFVAFQFDLEYPSNFEYINNSIVLTNRKADHYVSAGIISTNKLRVFAFSFLQVFFSGSSGTVAKLKFLVRKPTGSYPIKLSNAILSNELSQNIIKTSRDGTVQVLAAKLSLNVNIDSGWNLVSVPVNASNMDTKILFPEYVSNTFWYNNGYQVVTNLEMSKGYWIKYNQAKSINLFGTVSSSSNIAVKSGWNLIGVYHGSVQTNQITSNPSGIISSQFFGFNNGYVVPTELKPGKGYWIKVNQDGIIELGNTAIPKSTLDFAELSNDWGKIIITDNLDRRVTLYVCKKSSDLELLDLPPVPPAGIFDARFEGDKLGILDSEEGKSLYIYSAQYPITIKTVGTNLHMKDNFGGKILDKIVPPGYPVVITNPNVTSFEVRQENLPTVFALSQNYPNPFNPSTTIQFSISHSQFVILKVYDNLGREVATLVNEEKLPGNYEVKFDGSNLPSGVYFYRLQAGNFSQTKKLLLLK